MHGTVAIGHHRGAIEHQCILPAHDVEIGNGCPALACAFGQQCIALRMLAAFVWRGVGHQHQFGAGLHGVGQRLGEPEVFADHHAHLHALDRDHAVLAIRVHVEITTLVEHRIVRQFALSVGGFDAPIAQHAGGVIDHAAGALWPADHRHDTARGSRNPCQRLFAVRKKPGTQQQIFRRITADRQLGKQHDVGLELIARRCDVLDDAVGILRHAADREVELGHGDAEGVCCHC